MYCIEVPCTQQVAKNIVLAGVGTVTLVDNTPCGALYNFLVPAGADPAQRRASWLLSKEAQ